MAQESANSRKTVGGPSVESGDDDGQMEIDGDGNGHDAKHPQ